MQMTEWPADRRASPESDEAGGLIVSEDLLTDSSKLR
jgi:hypothetical protein